MPKFSLFSWISPAGARVVPIAASAVAHVAVAVVAVGGHGVGARALAAPGEIEVSVDVAPPVVTPPVPAADEDAKPSPSVDHDHDHPFPTHSHPYAVTPDHDAHPHDPSIDHRLAVQSRPEPTPDTEPAEAASVVTAEPTTPHFAMVFGRSADLPGGATWSGGTGVSHGAVDEGVKVADATLAESQVSEGAHLVSSVRPEYPLAARASEVEAHVALEIVVDRGGQVADAHVTRAAGFGFDESALAAVRRFRFSPAIRAGAPVRVRMRWTVDFRLE